MYTKTIVNAMREKLIAECYKSKAKMEGALNCNVCNIAKTCRSVSGHPPEYMADSKIITLWELSDLSKEITIESLVEACSKNTTVLTVYSIN